MSAFYINTIKGFIDDSLDFIVGKLTSQSSSAGFYQQKHSQTNSWINEITSLKAILNEVINHNIESEKWGILLEYPIARREKRIDIILLAANIILVIEFKSGKHEFTNADKDQLLDYCLDLRDFHYESRDKIIVPFLWASNAKAFDNKLIISQNLIQEIIYVNSENIHHYLGLAVKTWGIGDPTFNYLQWNRSDYSPTPTIIEAAQTLYAGKSVAEITRSHSEENLTLTNDAVIEAIKTAISKNEKIICFITGVPGAGKTLAGLNIAHHSDFQKSESSTATFLSGNGPLIKVLREALARDAFKKHRKIDKSVRKKETDRIISFIENVHQFIDAYFFEKEKVPNNKIVIFDEAQRAWNAEHSMRKFNRNFSEPEMMFEIMNRHNDWSVIVALVGGGQEINTGEAGLPEWGRVLEEKFSDWKAYISPELKIGNHSTGNLTLFESAPTKVEVIENSHLHLTVSIRSYKAEKLSEWVSFLLEGKSEKASEIFKKDLTNYPIVITRHLETAKTWLRNNCKGSRRMGLIASSGARRLRPLGLDVKADLEVEEWFLNSKEDVRSSYYLEIPATEFGIQGLELDWTGLCWDADMRRNESNWDIKSFRGSKWTTVANVEARKYAINKYRVLLTRAREGMIIFIPLGDSNDHTRLPSYYQNTVNYLKACGLEEI
ncbi:DUF2075 domain-containing protein [Mucilaginibacter sp. KACC 22063]|uniref:DUF2075 domain-containing protein n=1 Tax=Mucilaginibacter sp. KACC 22063 TaxID=3025666 RepID=UPI002366CEE4|nr:DUF2075 domain-containing protein [Mucilaginibacter sp. KACC 22063]WDF55454.1 DUF2075 domain-containing protein [Mucilaginibacter sp. KACC 22063]